MMSPAHSVGRLVGPPRDAREVGMGVVESSSASASASASASVTTHALAVVTTCALYAFGEWFLARVLCAETKDLISSRARRMFGVTFAVTSSMMFWIAYEIAGFVRGGETAWWWGMDLRCGAACVLVLAPRELFASGISSAMRRGRRRGGRGRMNGGGVGRERSGRGERRRQWIEAEIGATAAATAFAYAFVGISSARRGSGSDAATATAAMIGSEFSMARVMSRTAVLGTCLLGALSGFGAVHFPYTTIRVFHRAVPDAEVSSLERRLVQSVETIVERKKEIETLKREMARETRERGAKSGGGVLGRIASGFRLPVFQEGRAKRIIDINAEVDALEMVNRTLFADLHDINLLKERKRLAKTAYGRLLEACGVVMAVICGYRFVAGLKRLLFMQTPKSDPISFALHLFLANKSIHVDPEVLAQYLSLLLIAFLVINSMQNFILQLVKLFFAFGGGVTTDALVLFTTEMVGLYFISSVLLIREQLPERYRQSVTDALGADLEFRFYAKFYELIFMASAALTAFALYAKNVTASTPDDVTASASVSSLLAAEKKTNAAPLLPRSSKHP